MYLDARIVDLSRPSGLVTRQALMEAGLEPSADLTVTGPTRRRLAGVRVHRSGDLLPDHVRTVDGLPVTTVERTLADLGDVAAELTVARAMEKAIIDRRTTVERLRAVLDEIGRQGRNGRGALRRAVEGWQFAGRPPDSVLEAVFGRLVDRLGIPRPRFQHEVHDRGRLVARVDACWPSHRLIAEVDGHHFHASRAQFENDLRRQNRLVGLGYTVVRFTWQDVTRSASRVGSTLRHHLALAP